MCCILIGKVFQMAKRNFDFILNELKLSHRNNNSTVFFFFKKRKEKLNTVRLLSEKFVTIRKYVLSS